MNSEKEASQIQQLLKLESSPIAITFRSEPPPGIARVDVSAPSGCTYWKLAAEGRVFYTVASDHYGCPIGSYTHGVDLPPTQSQELEGMIGTMVGRSYLKMEEVPLIPRREVPFGVAIYAPLGKSPVAPDVIIVRGNARQMMLLSEAATAAGVSSANGIMGRPTCAMIPAVMKTQQAAISLGCIGNRVYNELEDGQMYSAFSAAQLPTVIQKLESITRANQELELFHQARRSPNKL